jgi:hypothetical protein
MPPDKRLLPRAAGWVAVHREAHRAAPRELQVGRWAAEALVVDVQPDPAGVDRLFVTAPEFDATFEVYGSAPVQGFGTVLGRDLYFRARHDGWSFDVADHPGNLPTDGYHNSDGFYREGVYPNASWMPLAESVKIIVRCLSEYTGVRA